MSNILIFGDIHLSDQDVITPQWYTKTFWSIIEQYIETLQENLRNEANIDLIVNLWDLVDGRYRGPKATQRYNNIQDRSHYILHAFGNADTAHIQAPIPQNFESTYQQSRYHVHELPDSLHIVVNATKDYTHNLINIASEDLTKLEQTLTSTNKPTFIYCHYPISEDPDNITYYHSDNPQACFVSQSSDIKQLLRQHPQVKARINAHTHVHREKEIYGVRHITIPWFAENRQTIDPQQQSKPCLMYITLNTQTLQITIHQIPH